MAGELTKKWNIDTITNQSGCLSVRNYGAAVVNIREAFTYKDYARSFIFSAQLNFYSSLSLAGANFILSFFSPYTNIISGVDYSEQDTWEQKPTIANQRE